ncbi:MAG: GNAT family N-acetyltransferase [Pseudomonadota bacterium]
MTLPAIASAPRRATLDDIPALTRLWQETGLYRPYNLPEWDVAFALQSPNANLLVWDDVNNVLIACILAGHDGHRGWIYYVGVTPDHQKTGLGRKIVTAAEDWLRACGVWRMQLMVRSENSAMQDYYRHLGYNALNVTVMQKDIDIPPADRLPADQEDGVSAGSIPAG